MIEYEIWLVTLDADGEEVPYQMIGFTSTRELAEALAKAANDTGYRAVILRSR